MDFLASSVYQSVFIYLSIHSSTDLSVYLPIYAYRLYIFGWCYTTTVRLLPRFAKLGCEKNSQMHQFRSTTGASTFMKHPTFGVFRMEAPTHPGKWSTTQLFRVSPQLGKHPHRNIPSRSWIFRGVAGAFSTFLNHYEPWASSNTSVHNQFKPLSSCFEPTSWWTATDYD